MTVRKDLVVTAVRGVRAVLRAVDPVLRRAIPLGKALAFRAVLAILDAARRQCVRATCVHIAVLAEPVPRLLVHAIAMRVLTAPQRFPRSRVAVLSNGTRLERLPSPFASTHDDHSLMRVSALQRARRRALRTHGTHLGLLYGDLPS